jgi:hypothetical protein
MKYFELFVEILGWIKIVMSPLLLGLFLGVTSYASIAGTLGLSLGILFPVLGLGVGIVWATRVWKKEGTMQFLSKTIATPELDRKGEES